MPLAERLRSSPVFLLRLPVPLNNRDAATREIARNIQQAATGTEEVTSNTAEVTTSVSQTGETANIVLGIADELAEQSNQLRDQVSSFLTSIRAA